MHVAEIKARIEMRGSSLTAIASELGVSVASVSLVIAGKSMSARTRKHIAKVAGIKESDIPRPHTRKQRSVA